MFLCKVLYACTYIGVSLKTCYVKQQAGEASSLVIFLRASAIPDENKPTFSNVEQQVKSL